MSQSERWFLEIQFNAIGPTAPDRPSASYGFPMDELKNKVQSATWRLGVERFLSALPWCLLATLATAAIAVAVGKVVPLPVAARPWTLAWTGSAVGIGFAFAAAWAWYRGHGPVAAALEIDRRFGLKERVSTTLALSDEQLHTQAGQALLQDATRRAAGLDVTTAFQPRLGPRAWLPLIPALAVFVLAMFVPDAQPPQSAQAETTSPTTKRQVKKSADMLRRKLAKRRQQAAERGLKDAEGLFKQLEEKTQTLKEQGTSDRRQAMIKLNDLARDLKKRRQAIGASEALKKQLQGLKNIHQGPADRLAKALREGDLKKALEQIDQLKEMLRGAKLDDQARQQLAKQLEAMKDQLKQAAEKHRQAGEQLRQAIQQANAAGDEAQAEQLRQKLDRLGEQQSQMAKMSELADQLGQAAEQLNQQQFDQAAEQLEQIAQDLEQMAQDQEELEMLDEALAQIAQAKDAMNCNSCGGGGCQTCLPGQAGPGQQPGPGNQLGAGPGAGNRPEEKDPTGTFDSRERHRVGQGKAVQIGEAHGPNLKGKVVEGIKSEMEAARREAADPLAGTRLPKKHQQHARQYFDQLREGEP